MNKLHYKFKTPPYKHQFTVMGLMLNHFRRGEKEFALLMEMGCGKTKVLLTVPLIYMTMDTSMGFLSSVLMVSREPGKKKLRFIWLIM